MRILVCGSRHFDDWSLLDDTLSDIWWEHKDVTIISGEAKGADWLAKTHAKHWDLNYEGYPAEWEKHGRAAGPIRNKQMLDEGKPDLVVAFLAKDSKGTKNMIEQAEKAGVPVKVIEI